jgi:hypothetical protein
MDGPIALTSAATIASTSSFFTSGTRVHIFRRRSRVLSVITQNKRNRFVVFASKEGDPPKLDQWDQMELKFGHLMGEDPKLTLAKVSLLSLLFTHINMFVCVCVCVSFASGFLFLLTENGRISVLRLQMEKKICS